MRATAQPPRGATIRDVAMRAGVSTATVSRALRRSAGVDPATRLRVEAAVRELRYRPSGVARSLKLRTTQTLGLIVTDIENPYFPQVVRAVEDAARSRGFSVVLADGRRDPERELQSLEILAERQVDGLLIASSAITRRHRSWIKERPCPVVIINSGSTIAGVPAVLSDNEAGGRMAAEHVMALGHRQLAYIAAPAAGNVAVRERLRGVHMALEAGHLGEEGLYVVQGDGGVEAGDVAARQVLSHRPRTSALICYNDLTAVGALRGVRSMGLDVPGDVSVVGFDDIELAPYVTPPLTTIRQVTEEMGHWAVDTLIAMITADPAAVPPDRMAAVDTARTLSRAGPGLIQRIPVQLVVRGSTARAPALAR